jgi:[ribosomal protein S5]-alanine N-acetyltransferase
MEFGIELAPDYWGCYAYAIEAGRAMLDFGFSELNLEAISGSTIGENLRINRLAEWFGAEVIATRANSVQKDHLSWSEVDWRIPKDR